MVRYIISCKRCAFRAEATSLIDLGSQLNAHASGCHDEPSIVLEASRTLRNARNELEHGKCESLPTLHRTAIFVGQSHQMKNDFCSHSVSDPSRHEFSPLSEERQHIRFIAPRAWLDPESSGFES